MSILGDRVKDYNVKDFRKERWNGLKQYYVYYLYCGGCDPAYDVLNYISLKEKLNASQRYYLSLLYGCTYNDSTAYTILKRIPFECSDSEVISLWKDHKDNLLFTSDRMKVKNFDELPNIIRSYKELIGDETQEEFFNKYVDMDISPEERYKVLYSVLSDVHYFGRFSLFNYLECLNEITPIDVLPDTLNLKEAESARNGLCYGCGRDSMITMHHKKPVEPIDYEYLNGKLIQLKNELEIENKEINVTYFNIETTLCGYKKLFWETRYLGYYIDRHGEGTKWMEDHNKDISYDLIWEFRNKYLDNYFNNTFIDKKRCSLMNETGNLFKSSLIESNKPILSYKNLIPHLRR